MGIDIIVNGFHSVSLLFGISLSIFPGWYKRKNYKGKFESENKSSTKFKGHHPDCNEFSGHRISINNKTYCAGCLGLIIGSIITIILILFYLLFDFLKINYYSFLIFGIIQIFILFFIIILFKKNPNIRVFSNAIFVISFFIIIISILEITGDFIYGLLTGLFSFLLIHTRIHISKWIHLSICKKCSKDCKMY